VSELYLTQTRRRLLHGVEHGSVVWEAGQAWDKVTGYKVTAAMAEMERAGWVERVLDPAITDPTGVYRLTEAGRLVVYPPPPEAPSVGSVWRDRANPGRRLRVDHTTDLLIEVTATYSVAADAWDNATVRDAVLRLEWTAQRYVSESTPDGGS
jgi:hypothetical protein